MEESQKKDYPEAFKKFTEDLDVQRGCDHIHVASMKELYEDPLPDIVDLLKRHGYEVIEGAEAVRKEIRFRGIHELTGEELYD